MKHTPILLDILRCLLFFQLVLPVPAWAFSSVEGIDGTHGGVGDAALDATTDRLFCSQAAKGPKITLPNATGTLNSCGSYTITTTDIGTTAPSASGIPVAGTDSKIDISWLPVGTDSNSVMSGTDTRLGRSTDTLQVTSPLTIRTGTTTATATSGVISNTLTIGAPGVMVGTLTANYLPKATGAQTLDNSTLYQATDNTVGVGTTVPNASLAIYAPSLPSGTISYSADLAGKGIILSGVAATTSDKLGVFAQFNYNVGIAAGMVLGRYGNSWGTYVAWHTHPPNADAPDTFNEGMRLDGAGHLGIGNTAPSALLTLGTAGALLGNLSLAGDTSGTVTIRPPAAAGSATLQLPLQPSGGMAYVVRTGTGTHTGTVTTTDTSTGTITGISGAGVLSGANIYAGTGIALMTGTSTATVTVASLANSPKIVNTSTRPPHNLASTVGYSADRTVSNGNKTNLASKQTQLWLGNFNVMIMGVAPISIEINENNYYAQFCYLSIYLDESPGACSGTELQKMPLSMGSLTLDTGGGSYYPVTPVTVIGNTLYSSGQHYISLCLTAAAYTYQVVGGDTITITSDTTCSVKANSAILMIEETGPLVAP